ncbi:hypothetical protein P8452_29627 [Trifolium repens]|nr:hypothetical protein P8452_29627 [Trifolium repens]
MLSTLGLAGVFGVYAVVCVISFIFVYLKVPETKGMPLEVITEFFSVEARDVSLSIYSKHVRSLSAILACCLRKRCQQSSLSHKQAQMAFPDICDRIRLLLEELQRDYGTQIAEKEEEVKQLKQQLEIQFAEKDEVVKQQLKEKDEEIKKLKELIKVMKSAGEDVGKRLRDSRQMIGELNQLIKGMEEKENISSEFQLWVCEVFSFDSGFVKTFIVIYVC